MEMEDHHHQQYGMTTDLRQLVNAPRSTHFPSIVPPHPTVELFPGHRNLTPLASPHHQQHFEMMMFGRGLHDFATTTTDAAAAAVSNSISTVPTPAVATTSASTPPLSGLEAETTPCIGGDASTGRWPRQETLTLLEIRSRLDPKFKEANQKGPLWDEVSRIMSEEHGYQRSGKKCREKFENLYKYYKKTKEGKAGRHDGKHYRFFRQLEALYGENSNNTPSLPAETNFVNCLNFQTPSQTNQELMFQSHHNKHCDSLSLTNSTDFATSSSDDDDNIDHTHTHSNENDSTRRKRKSSGSSWKVKIKEFIDSQMRKLVEKQEEWLDKIVKTLEEKEKERMLREEEWRKQEVSRLEREKRFWAKERAWIEARDAALMEALQNITGRDMKADHEGVMPAHEIQNQNEDGSEILNSTVRGGADSWPESEITRLQQLRTEMETRFIPQSGGCSEEVTWEEVATKMACFGYERTALMCKEKWESICNYPRDANAKEGNNKKGKENSRSCFYFNSNDQSSLYNQGSSYCDQRQEIIGKLQTNDGSSPSNSNVAPSDSCFPFLMSEGGNLWENYGLKLSKAASQNH